MMSRINSYDVASRIVDFVASLIALLALSPLLVLIAALVLFKDGRPVLFRQTRVGRHGNPFRILKFRTMRNFIPGTEVTAGADPRVTRIGRILRRYKLDELPQLFNVLKGEMSFIGPRPEVPAFVQLDNLTWQRVLSVRPGITDVASLLYRDEEAILGTRQDPEQYYRAVVLPAKLDLNIRHLESRSPARDFKLLAMTIQYSFFPSITDAQHIRKVLTIEGQTRD